jgi:hypothetical protein
MKNLQRNYSKVFIQQNQCIITNYYNGFEVHIYQNQIGFTNYGINRSLVNPTPIA